MNLHVLTKLYDHLSARERLTLFVAASVRGDAVERQRLVDSTSSAACLIPHRHALAQALDKAATMPFVTLLDGAANFWQWWGLWGSSELRSQNQTVLHQVGADAADDPKDEEAEVVRILCVVH
jgi:hypothetical protein